MATSRLTSVAAGGIILGLSTSLSRFLGLARNIAINYAFGHNSGEAKAYVDAFNVPDLIFSILASGAVAAAFIPVFTDLYTTGREKQAWRVFSSLANFMFLVVAVLVAALMYLAPWVISVQFPNSPLPETTVLMSRILLPAQVAFMVGGVLQGTLYARREYLVPSVAMNLYNLGIIGGALVLSRMVSPAVSGLAWGALAGAWLGAFLLPVLAMRKNGSQYRLGIDWKDPHFRQVLLLMLPVILGQSLGSWLVYLLRIFSDHYGPQVTPAVVQANELFQAPAGVFGQSMALAVFPALSELWARQDRKLFHEQTLRTLRQTVFLSMPVASLFISVPVEICRFLYQHGRMEPEAVMRVGTVLQAFAFGVPAWCALPVLTRAYFATKSTKVPVILSTVATVVFIAACWGVVKTGMPFQALAWATSIVGTALVLAQWSALVKRVGAMATAELRATLVLSMLGASVMGGVAWGIIWGATQVGAMSMTWSSMLVTFCACLIAAWAYYFFAVWAKMPEAAYLQRAVDRRKKKSSS
jgi:putative peptidoglycan lipid II flippase